MKFKGRSIIEFLLVIVIFLIAIGYWIGDFRDQDEILLNKKVTEGVIVDYEIVGTDNHYVTYEYFVEGNHYKSRVIPKKIIKNCQKTRGCIGQKFRVYYSSKNPKKSFIDLENPIK